jgi:hypothetical protein
MKLIARYTLDTESRFDIHLLEIETDEVINVIPYSAGEQADHPLMELAREWAAQHNHEITEIDSTQLHA